MYLRLLRPMFWVYDVKVTIAYYEETLGFRCSESDPEWGWAEVERDDVQILFATPGTLMPNDGPSFTGSIYISTDDVDEWWNLLRLKAEILYPIENFEYGMREFAIKDCNGYTIQFGQEIQS